MRQTDKSLQSEKVKQAVGGLGKPLGKRPARDRIQSPRDLDRSFPCWPGSGYFGTAPGGVLYTAEGPRPFQLGTPDRRKMGCGLYIMAEIWLPSTSALHLYSRRYLFIFPSPRGVITGLLCSYAVTHAR